MRAKIHLIVLFFSVSFSSCEIINPGEEIPSYVRVESILLATDTLSQGSAANKISDVWLYVDDQPLGVYEMPVSIPVLESGIHPVAIRAGVIVNGIASTRVYYPFYAFYNDTIILTPGSITTVSPVVHYYSGTVFSMNEPFNGPGYQIIATTAVSDTNYYIVTDAAHTFEGPAGAAYLDASHPVFECESNDSLVLPINSPVYMELNYKTNTEFTVGMYGITLQNYDLNVLNIRPTSEWKKIYINLTPAIELFTNTYGYAFGYKPYIRMIRNSDVGDAQLYFDNIKVVHF